MIELTDEQSFEDQEMDFKLPNGTVIRAWVDIDGKLKLNAISNGTKLAVEPLTQNSLSVVGLMRH